MEVSLEDFRKDIILELHNEAGQKVKAYNIYRCWVSEYQAMPDLDANANAVAIQHIKLENEGWERDISVTEPPNRRSISRPDSCHASSITAAELLNVWEAGHSSTSTRRAVLLLAAMYPEARQDALASLSIGRRDAELLRLREMLWGR